MAKFSADVRIDMSWVFDIEAEDEEAAYEVLWSVIGYDGEDIVQFDHEPDSEFMDIDMRRTVVKEPFNRGVNLNEQGQLLMSTQGIVNPAMAEWSLRNNQIKEN